MQKTSGTDSHQGAEDPQPFSGYALAARVRDLCDESARMQFFEQTADFGAQPFLSRGAYPRSKQAFAQDRLFSADHALKSL